MTLCSIPASLTLKYTILRKISILCAETLTSLMHLFFEIRVTLSTFYIVFMIFIHFSIIVVSFAFLIVINIQPRTPLETAL